MRYRHPTPQVAPAVISLSRIDNRRETPLLFLLRSIDFMPAETLISKEFRSKRRGHFVRYRHPTPQASPAVISLSQTVIDAKRHSFSSFTP